MGSAGVYRPMYGQVYHERQLGHLCGVHCVNNLLQGPRFGPGDFAEIGVRLDKKERKLLGGDEPRDPEGITGSANFDASADGGNFSIQVLRIAFARAGLKLVPADHPDSQRLIADPPRAAGAFLVQRRDHWFALRRVGPCWWDLDSMLAQPRPLEEPQLAERVRKLVCSSRSSVFLVVGGVLPEPRPPSPGRTGRVDFDDGDNWHDISKLLDPDIAAYCLQAAEDDRRGDSSPPSPASPMSSCTFDGYFGEERAPCLETFGECEVRAALALAGGCRAVAADVLWKAHRSVESLLTRRSPKRLAKAWAANVDAVLSAQRSLPETVARLVVLLCAPPEEQLASAAALVDCGDLAHRLLTALAKKARGWLWTEGLAQAATLAVERLLAMPTPPTPAPVAAQARGPTSETEGSTELQRTRTHSSSRSGDAEEESGAFVEERRAPETEGFEASCRIARRNATFEALSDLLGDNTPPEAPPPGRPSVSEPGLKAVATPSLAHTVTRAGGSHRRSSGGERGSHSGGVVKKGTGVRSSGTANAARRREK